MATVTRIPVMPYMPEMDNEKGTEEPTGIAILPYQLAVSNKISRLLAKRDIKTHHLPVKKTTRAKIGLKTTDICYIPCGCGKMHVRQAAIL